MIKKLRKLMTLTLTLLLIIL